MTYTITTSDMSNVQVANSTFTIDSFVLDTSNTALTLPGKEYSGWGQFYTQNLVNLMDNFAVAEPSVKRVGMLWYDRSTSKLKVWGGPSWTTLDAAADQLSTPRNISLSGDATGTVAFDGSANVVLSATLATVLTGTGATANTAANIPGVIYNSPAIVVDAKGRIVSITNTGGDGNAPPTYVSTFNTRPGAVTLTSLDVTNALGFTPTNGGITSLTSGAIISALGYTPANNNLVLLKSGGSMSGQLDMAGQRIQNLPSPVGGSEPARLADVQAVYSARTQRIYNGTAEQGYNVTVSPNAPSGGSDGDVWYRY